LAAGICIFLSLLREGAAGWIWAHAPHTHNEREKETWRSRLILCKRRARFDIHCTFGRAQNGKEAREREEIHPF